MRDYESNETTNKFYCDAFCKDKPCVKQCKRWGCSNCEDDNSIDASEITDAVTSAKEIWQDKKGSNYISQRELWYTGGDGRTGRSYHHFSDNLAGVDDNNAAWNVYKRAVPVSELRSWK
jgi:hypothetical protein